MSESGATIQVYKCPTCGGAVRYSASKASLACSWCGNVYEASGLEVKEVAAELEGYQCPECGAQLMTDDFIAADTCPFCGNNEIAPQRFEGEFEPDFIIPFSVSKAQAVECYEQMLQTKEYLPDDYQAESRILSIQGTYVPFWLFSGTLDFDYTFETIKRRKNANTVEHHHRAGTYDITRLPADGSARMADDMMDSIEPYDYSALAPFAADCIPGFMAERFTVGYNDVVGRVCDRVSISAAIESGKTITIAYDERHLEQDRFHSHLHCDDVRQVLLPVWLIAVSYRGEKYLVGVNGQTGKVAVNLPVDEAKQAKRARGQMVARSWWVALIMLAPAIVEFVYSWMSNGRETVFSTLAAAAGGAPYDDGLMRVALLMLVLLAVGVGASIWYFFHTYKEVKEEVRKTMQNVEESIDASAFGTMNITVSEFGQGPLREPESA